MILYILCDHTNKIQIKFQFHSVLLLGEQGIFYFSILSNVSSDTACCMCLLALHCTIPGAFFFVMMFRMNAILFEYLRENLSDSSNIIIRRFVYVLANFSLSL